ncbi:alpha-amylase family glycosyl hydrolase [Gracilibacillus alcaliphilus]|uniref:alpha-amylase family glycosyl hydrolase n=1 Tax=Gracilibacillus alcaliphilus TaxID=1401441 RepID=UPI00195BCFBD|nr:alpha-amylase family glycosyl hydrolase [Gracilibacillus alcaliphilus]MBM7677664.1 glycosidase [Gracilibacillus alcaliphilus]
MGSVIKVFRQTIALIFVLFSLFICFTFESLTVEASNKVNYAQDTIYQIVTDRFEDGDPSNNPSGELFNPTDLHKYHGGDWQGIIDRIEDGYITDMGVTALWISQPVENVYAVHPNGYTSYHGYWARDYKKTNPFYGDFDKFDELIQIAGQHHIKIIMDFTPNHSSPALETDPDYAENGAVYDNGHLISKYSDDSLGVFHHNGGTDFSTYEDGIYRNLYDLADYNLQNEAMDQYLKESIELWLDKGIAGIRVDAVKHMPQGWQETLVNHVYSHEPVFTFGEWFLGEGEIDPRNHYFANESGMSLLDFQYGQQIRSVLMTQQEDWLDFHEMIEQTAASYHVVIDQVTFIDNHDMSRFHKDGEPEINTEMALAVLLTSRGVPTIYYGTEQYMTGETDPENRKMMTNFDDSTTAYQIISKLAHLRQDNLALGYGDTTERWINEDVYIYERSFGNHVVVTAVNSGDVDYTINNLVTALPEGNYEDVLDGLLNGQSIQVGTNGAVNNFVLQANEAAVWEVSNNADNPLIGQVGPMAGQPGNSITISGEGFGTTEGNVYFGTETVSIASWNDQEIVIEIPDISSGRYDIQVMTADQQESNLYPNFEVLTNHQLSVRFKVEEAYTDYGTEIYLVGNTQELGNWDPEQAIGPFFNEIMEIYPNWYYDVSVPADQQLEYKFIKKDGAGNIVWESGPNHTYTVPESGTDTVTTNWRN